MKLTLINLFLFMAIGLGAQDLPQTFIIADAPRYSEETGYGFDRIDSPSQGSNKPFYFSVRVPDGNYRVTVKLGSKKQNGNTTVRGESRRLFIENVSTKKGECIEESFTINKRSPHISKTESVKIKSREATKLNWDDRLTLEFNGDAPVCESIRIEEAGSSVITLFLCGNSTVVDQDNEPWASWGQMIPKYFNTNVSVANYAESGESANTFIGAKRLAKALSEMTKGDYFFIEFGHNDQKQKGPGKGAYYSYMTNLKIFVDEVRSRGGYPVLVTPTSRRRFDKDGQLVNTLGDFPEAVHWLAEKENIPLIDLNAMTATLLNALGEDDSKKAFVFYPAGSFAGQTKELADNTHFSAYGACQIAKCVIEGMKTATPELTKYLKTDPSYNPAHPDDIQAFRWWLSPFNEIEKPDGD